MKIAKWIDWNISTRVNFITVLLSVLMFVAYILYSYKSGQAEVQEQLDDQGRSLAAALAQGSELSVFSGNQSNLQLLIDGLIQANPSIFRIDVLDARRREVIHAISKLTSNLNVTSYESPIRKQLLAVDAFDANGSPSLSDANGSMPKLETSTIIGYVQVSMSPSHLLKKQTTRLQYLLAMAMAVLIMAALFASYLFSRSLTRPITRCIDALRLIRSGRFPVQVAVTSGGELGELQLSINEMSASIEQAKQDLENKVLARTKDLETSRNEAVKADAEKRRLIQKLNSVVEEERKTIAIEIHDELNAILIAARLDSQRILNLAAQLGTNPAIEEIKAKAQSINQLTLDLYANARKIVRRLRPEVLDMLGLHGAVEEIIRYYDSAHPDCRFDFHSTGDYSKLENTVAIAVYRLVQEGLSNIVKHSGATSASVSLLLNEEESVLQLTIADNGCGFDPGKLESGIGIIGMRERVYAFNGNFEVQVAAGGGSVIRIRLPLIREFS